MKETNEKWVIVRSDKAGVFFGILGMQKGEEVFLKKARKLYHWEGAYTVEDLADKGVRKEEEQECKFTCFVNNMTVNTVCQCIECTEEAIKSLNSIFVWTA
jgi:hypothetical protein